MISTFGVHAERIRNALPLDLHVVAFDISGLCEAYVEGVARRERGESFYVLPLIDNYRVSTYTSVAQAINQIADPDTRYMSGTSLATGELEVNGAPARRLIETDNRPWPLVYQMLNMADELLVRSHFEYAALYALRMATRRVRRILLGHSLPDFTPRRVHAKPSVVVWCGRRWAREGLIALIGLEEFRGVVTYIGDEAVPNVRARFVSRDDPSVPDILAGAGCIVCIDPADPADAVELARRGASVVAPITSGAIEFATGIVSWDAGNTRHLYNAVSIALGRGPGGENPDVIPSKPPAAPLPVPEEALPLVTIITATYNRRTFLRQMLTCLAAQTYPRVESVIVNDGGELVDDIVAEFPFARLINLEQNRGTLGAQEVALEAARGEYIGLLPDDDWLYPDHISRLMSAILQSGAAVGHSHSLIRFLKRKEDGTDRTVGYNGLAFCATNSPTASLISTCVAGHQCLQRRDTFAADDVGWYLKDAVAADQEYHMRLFERHQLVQVEGYTCEFRDHVGNTGKNHNWAETMTYIYDEVQPLENRPVIEEARRKNLELLRQIPVGTNVNSPSLLL